MNIFTLFLSGNVEIFYIGILFLSFQLLCYLHYFDIPILLHVRVSVIPTQYVFYLH